MSEFGKERNKKNLSPQKPKLDLNRMMVIAAQDPTQPLRPHTEVRALRPLCYLHFASRPEVDGVGERMHGGGVTADEVAPEDDPLQAVGASQQEGDLTDVVADGDQEALQHVFHAKPAFQRLVTVPDRIGCNTRR